MATHVAHRVVAERGRSAADAPSDEVLSARVETLMESLSNVPPGLDDDVQNELGVLLRLLPAIERVQPQRRDVVLRNFEIATRSLLATPPNRILAMRLREDCEQQILARKFYRAILPGSSASTWVIAGLFAFLYVLVPAAMLVVWWMPQSIWVYTGRPGGTGIPVTLVGIIALTGAVGSVVSILVRIKDFTELRILNPPALFWTGFFKPVIGAAFATFIYVAFRAGVLSVGEGINEDYVYLTLAFIAGFSERFAPDLVSRVEQSVMVGDGPQRRGTPTT